MPVAPDALSSEQATDPGTARGRLRRPSGTTAAVAGLIVIGLGLRIWLAATPLGGYDGDEATTGIMVDHILHGHWYVFLAGQDYNGAAEQYLQALLWLFLPHTIWTLRSVEFAFYVVIAVAVYRTAVAMFSRGRRPEQARWRGVVATGVFCLGPYFNIWKGIHSHGAYSIGQLVAVTSLWAAAGLDRGNRGSAEHANRADRGDRAETGRVAFIGLCLGLSFWLSWSSLMLVAPACVWAIPSLLRRIRRVVPFVLAAGVGATPAIAFFVSRGQQPGIGGPQPASTPGGRLLNVIDPVGREFLGLGYRYGNGELPVLFQRIAIAFVIAGVLVAVVWRARGLLATVIGRRDGRRPADVLLLVPLVMAAGFAVSSYGWWTGEPRYLFSAYPALALGVAAAIPGRSRALVAGVGAAAMALSATSSVSVIAEHNADGRESAPSCLGSAVDQLVTMGITDVYSDYWTGMPLQLVAGHRLTVAPVGGGRTKFPDERAAVDAQPRIAYVAGHIRDPMNEEPDDVLAVKNALAAAHVTATQTPLACGLVLFTNFSPDARPWQIGIGLAAPGDPTLPPVAGPGGTLATTP